MKNKCFIVLILLFTFSSLNAKNIQAFSNQYVSKKLVFFSQNPQISNSNPPQLQLPTENSTNVSLNPTLSWSSVVGAVSYRIQISTDSNFTNLHSNIVESSNNVILSGLLPQTQYWWRVCAKDLTDSTAWSIPRYFITKNADSAQTIGIGTDYDVAQPIDRYYSYSSCEMIYTQSELGNAKFIKSIAFFKGFGDNKEQITGIQIFMKHTTQQAFTSGNYSLSGYSLVYQGNYPNNLDSGWLEVDLNSMFYYNGVNNLQILIIKSYQTPLDYFEAPSWRFSLLNDNLQRSSSSDFSQPVYLDALPFRPDIRFRYVSNLPSQLIALSNGWNMISSNIDPYTQNIPTLMAPLSGNLQILRNYVGQSYVPPFTNTLSNWNKYHAYQLRLTTSQQYEIQGSQIAPETTPITLNTIGWYWLPYYRTTSAAVATALASISGKYLQVKTITGEVYMPPFANTLTQLEPGKGYMIRLTADDGVLTYPANGPIKATGASNSIAEPKVFVRENVSTGKNAFVALDLDLRDGDEVGVFTRDGLLVGSSVWQSALRGVVVWGDDEYTNEKDGAYEGEELIVKVWSRSDETIGSVRVVESKDMTNGVRGHSLRYETDAIMMLKGGVEYDQVGLTITPQPASSELIITLGKVSNDGVEVEFYNQSGRIMLRANEKASNGVIKLNVSDLPSGVYSVIIRNGAVITKERAVIVR